MVVEPAFTYFFTLREGGGGGGGTLELDIRMVIVPTFSLYGKGLRPNYCGRRSLLPSSENLVNKIKVQNVIFIFLKTVSHLTGHLNISIAFYFLSFFR